MWRVFFSNVSRVMPSSTAWARVHDRPARADSRMTSPSWPVRMKSSLPSILVTSTATTSPPTSVTTRPVAAPGLVLGLELAVLPPRRAEELDELLDVDDGLALAALGDGAGRPCA